jgi:hypothetical protein
MKNSDALVISVIHLTPNTVGAVLARGGSNVERNNR